LKKLHYTAEFELELEKTESRTQIWTRI